MSPSFGLKSYLALADGRIPGLGVRRIGVESLRCPERPQEHLGVYRDDAVRPRGALVWMHVSSCEAALALTHLTQIMDDDRPNLGFVLTTTDRAVFELEFDARVQVVLVPDDTTSAVTAFLDHWRPDIGFWVGLDLRPALIWKAADRGIPLFAADAPREHGTRPSWRFAPGLRRNILSVFQKIFVGDGAHYAQRLRMGALSWTLEELGYLEPSIDLPGCDDDNLEALSGLIGVRPVFLAMSVSADEEQDVLVAFKIALRRAHRLLLVLAPAEPGAEQRIIKTCATIGLSVARQDDFCNRPDCQVMIVGDMDDAGLWYRLAPIAFLGQSLGTGQGGGISPLVAAALGSAIIHGPNVDDHKGSYNVLKGANAAVLVRNAPELAAAIESLQAPDRVAAMAHAAWTVESAGAEVRERIAQVLLDALDRKGAPR